MRYRENDCLFNNYVVSNEIKKILRNDCGRDVSFLCCFYLCRREVNFDSNGVWFWKNK